jgi:hypothetical protein
MISGAYIFLLCKSEKISRPKRFRRSAETVFSHGAAGRCGGAENTVSALRGSCKTVSGGNFSIY